MIQHLKDHPTAAFSPEEVSVLSDALDEAWRRIEANKSAYKIDDNALDLLAKHIVDMALQGELDLQRPVQSALDRLKL
jgi:hypothetical protein